LERLSELKPKAAGWDSNPDTYTDSPAND
jgi:hypothetical protein